MRVPYGYVAARHVRSVESNTMYHVRPGARALTFGMLGCDLRCPYCHNWRLSQALRDRLDEAPISDCDPTTLVDEACAAACTVVCAAYNEPMITAEWAHAVFTEARRRGLATALVSDGNTTPEALAYLRPVTDVYRVDVKGLTAAEYRVLGGDPAAPLAAIREARRLGYWVEAVTVVVPGFNDDVAELRALAAALVAIDRDLPWHLNAFVPRYRMRDRPRTAAAILVSAAGTAYAQGMRYVYVGNVPDVVPELSHTRCPACRWEVVRRRNYEVEAVTLAGGRCAACDTSIPGMWT
jgi:pyruvate formate lyase activating enzyme